MHPGVKRSSDRNNDFLRVKEDEANEQHRSIIEALRAAAPEWTFEQINFVAGRRGAVVDTILLSANTWVFWGSRDDVDGEHWRTSVCVNNSQFFVISC